VQLASHSLAFSEASQRPVHSPAQSARQSALQSNEPGSTSVQRAWQSTRQPPSQSIIGSSSQVALHSACRRAAHAPRTASGSHMALHSTSTSQLAVASTWMSPQSARPASALRTLPSKSAATVRAA